MDKLMKIILDFAVIFVIYIFLLKRWKLRGKCVLVANSLMYIYIVAVLSLTLMPIVSSLPHISYHPYTPMNMMPFRDILINFGEKTLRQVVLNVVMTIPFGFLLPLCKECKSKKHGILQCVLYSATLSISIELLQPLINAYRVADITDIITNTFGGFIGYVLFLLLHPVISKFIR